MHSVPSLTWKSPGVPHCPLLLPVPMSCASEDITDSPCPTWLPLTTPNLSPTCCHASFPDVLHMLVGNLVKTSREKHEELILKHSHLPPSSFWNPLPGAGSLATGGVRGTGGGQPRGPGSRPACCSCPGPAGCGGAQVSHPLGCLRESGSRMHPRTTSFGRP